MNVFNLSVSIALLAITYCKGSEAKVPSQLIAKKSDGTSLKPENALVAFVYTPGERFFGGGALISRTTVIAPFIIFSPFYLSYSWALSNFRVAIGLNPFDDSRLDRQHHLKDLKHNVGPNCDEEKAIALVTIDPISEGDYTPPPSWVQHIPIASHSYTPGLHSISGSVVTWDERSFIRNSPISRISVDNVGIISTQIPVAHGGKYLKYLKKYLGGFISHEGILIGLLFKHQPIRNIGQTIEVSFLPVDGNNKLIKDSKDKGIKIIDIHLARSSNKRKRNGKEPSDKLE